MLRQPGWLPPSRLHCRTTMARLAIRLMVSSDGCLVSGLAGSKNYLMTHYLMTHYLMTPTNQPKLHRAQKCTDSRHCRHSGRGCGRGCGRCGQEVVPTGRKTGLNSHLKNGLIRPCFLSSPQPPSGHGVIIVITTSPPPHHTAAH